MKEIYLISILYLLAAARLLTSLFCKRIPCTLRSHLKEYLDSFMMAGMTAMLLITYVARSFYIPSESMLPTLLVNDYILVNRFVYVFSEPSRGDIVVFHPPHIQDSETNFIKRVVALENDVVEVSDGILYLNGAPQNEPFIKEAIEKDFHAYRVPPGHIFVMGDNRNNSDDSRYWGPLPLKNVQGKAFVIFWPFHRIRHLR